MHSADDEEIQQEYLQHPPNTTTTCYDSTNYYGELESQTLECLAVSTFNTTTAQYDHELLRLNQLLW